MRCLKGEDVINNVENDAAKCMLLYFIIGKTITVDIKKYLPRGEKNPRVIHMASDFQKVTMLVKKQRNGNKILI